jgi:Protein kinase domain
VTAAIVLQGIAISQFSETVKSAFLLTLARELLVANNSIVINSVAASYAKSDVVITFTVAATDQQQATAIVSQIGVMNSVSGSASFISSLNSNLVGTGVTCSGLSYLPQATVAQSPPQQHTITTQELTKAAVVGIITAAAGSSLGCILLVLKCGRMHLMDRWGQRRLRQARPLWEKPRRRPTDDHLMPLNGVGSVFERQVKERWATGEDATMWSWLLFYAIHYLCARAFDYDGPFQEEAVEVPALVDPEPPDLELQPVQQMHWQWPPAPAGADQGDLHQARRVDFNYLTNITGGFAQNRKLGEGAYGRVYRGVDGALGLRLAVKRLDPGAPWGPWNPERSLHAEVNMLLRFRHDNIIRLVFFCDDGPDRCCLAYELGARGALSDNLVDDARAADLTWIVRVRIKKGIASALSYLNRSHPPAWHRDVKAANVVLTAALEPKLIDCGLSKLLTAEEAARGGLTATGGDAFGTRGYMCPDYTVRGIYKESSEVYSFGVVMLELITGKLQLGGNRQGLNLVDEVVANGVLAQHRDARAGAWRPDAIAQLERLAIECVDRQPAGRPTSFAVFRELNGIHDVYCPYSEGETWLRQEIHNAHRETEELRARIEAAHLAEQAARAAAEEEAQAARVAAEAAAEAENPQRECALPQCLGLCEPEPQLRLSDGIECTRGHFTSNACLTGYARQLAFDPAQLNRYRGKIRCMGCPDDAPPFGDAEVARRIPQDAFNALNAAAVRAMEGELNAALEREFNARLRAIELRMGQNASVRQLRDYVVEKILTLHCPACDQAFIDFTGCFALRCSRCNAGFCAWCLAHCNRDAHAHVLQCPWNNAPDGGYFGTEHQFKQAQGARRDRMLRLWLARQNPALLQALLNELEPDLREMDPPMRAADYRQAHQQQQHEEAGGPAGIWERLRQQLV